jgi:glycosyltransferase involved in cell wall biosynthesis
VGEPTLRECLNSIKGQSLKPDELKIVENVRPMHAAFNKMLELADGDFHLHVDADMILEKKCLETLYNAIKDDENCFCARAGVDDGLIGNTGSIKLYRSRLVKRHKYEDVLACDRVFEKKFIKEGFQYAALDDLILAKHHPNYKPKEAFNRFKRTGEKCYRLDGPKGFEHFFRRLVQKYLDEGDKAALMAAIGLCHGLFSDDVKEKDFKRYDNKEVKRLLKFFNET